MKLVFCKECQDIFKLDFETRYCKCGKSSGKYLNTIDAVYSGEFAVPIGINNRQLANAVFNPHTDTRDFNAFVFDDNYSKFKKGEVNDNESKN